MDKTFLLLLGVVLLAGCTGISCTNSVSHTDWTYCDKNIQYRNVTESGAVTTENRSCTELTAGEIILSLEDLPIGYLLVNSSSESSNSSYVVGELNGMSYTMGDLGYVESAEREYSYESPDANFEADLYVSIYSPAGVETRFAIGNKSWYNGSLSIPNMYQVSGRKIGTNSVVYAVIYNTTVNGEVKQEIRYNQFCYVDRYWINTYVWGEKGGFNPEILEELNRMMLDKLNALSNIE